MFTGRRYDKETGLYYYRARYYNPQIGRFLQTDPVGYGDGMNMYRYCRNNPLVLVDPKGSFAYVWRNVNDDDKYQVMASMLRVRQVCLDRISEIDGILADPKAMLGCTDHDANACPMLGDLQSLKSTLEHMVAGIESPDELLAIDMKALPSNVEATYSLETISPGSSVCPLGTVTFNSAYFKNDTDTPTEDTWPKNFSWDQEVIHELSHRYGAIDRLDETGKNYLKENWHDAAAFEEFIFHSVASSPTWRRLRWEHGCQAPPLI
jgi:RHS repeat-associated protein